jgi:hypothetical protein
MQTDTDTVTAQTVTGEVTATEAQATEVTATEVTATEAAAPVKSAVQIALESGAVPNYVAQALAWLEARVDAQAKEIADLQSKANSLEAQLDGLITGEAAAPSNRPSGKAG